MKPEAIIESAIVQAAAEIEDQLKAILTGDQAEDVFAMVNVARGQTATHSGATAANICENIRRQIALNIAHKAAQDANFVPKYLRGEARIIWK